MAALSNVHAASLLNTSLRSGTYYLALFLTDPTAAATGTEASGGGYARKIITFGAPSLVSGRQQVTNTAAVDYGVITADIGTVSPFYRPRPRPCSRSRLIRARQRTRPAVSHTRQI